MYARILPLVFCALILSSCIANKDQPKTVMLKHPETLDFQKCSVEDWGSNEGYAYKDRCVEEWKEQGYIVWGSQ